MALPRHLDFGTILRTGEFPYGASYFMGLFGDAIRLFIQNTNSRGSRPWSSSTTGRSCRRPKGAFPSAAYVWRHPLYWPLSRNIGNSFRRLLSAFEFDIMSRVGEGGCAQ
jgi:hypothetical protein